MSLSGADPEIDRPFELSIGVQSIYGFLRKESLILNHPLALTSQLQSLCGRIVPFCLTIRTVHLRHVPYCVRRCQYMNHHM